MLITDHFFLLYFFPLFIIIYYLVHKSPLLSNLTIILFSCIFYATFGLKNLPILLLPLFLDYFGALALARIKDKQQKKLLLITLVVINLGILAYYKYTLFLTQNLLNFFPNSTFLTTFPTAVIIPVGISFITFQRISYIIDAYRGTIKPTTNLIEYTVYATLYPHLISGPIVRFSNIKDQLKKRALHGDVIFTASKYIVFGMFFKLLIANQLFNVEEVLTSHLETLDSLQSLLLIFFFTFRIYFDFLGYSLMAIGLAKFIGFDFPENFDSPYQSKSITEFWRRWNMTLSAWIRDYVYIPLGGNRKGKIRTLVNLIITMLLAGLWHGASWNFVLWGGFHGVLLALERVFSDKIKFKLPSFLKVLYSFSLVSLLWITFKFATPTEIMKLLQNIFGLTFSVPDHITMNIILWSLPAWIIAIIWSFFFHERSISQIPYSKKATVALCLAFILILGFSLIRRSVPFIYFQF